MSFAFPQFLWALSALAIPVIIHLFNFRRTTRIFFSNTRLLKQVKEETTRKRKLKQYLILASRLLFLFFLVLAFAQPFLPAKEQMTAGRELIIYLDNSYSMSAQVGEKIRALDQGISFVKEIVALFPADTRYKFITNDFAPFSNSFKTKSEIEDLLTQVRLSPVGRTHDEVVKRMGDVARRDVFWVSDFQKATFGEPTALHDSTSQWHLIPLSLGQSSNVFVDTVYLDNPFFIGGERNSIHLKLRSTGSRGMDKLIAKLSVNGIQTASVSASLQPNSTAELNFDIASGLFGLNEAKISFNDFPVSFDNDFYFTLNFSERMNVVEVKAGRESTFVQRVYGNELLFNYKGMQAANVDYSMLQQADVVILNGLDKIDDALAASIMSSEKQYSLFIAPGPKPDLASYQKLVPLRKLSLLPAAEKAELDRPDFEDPFFQNVFEERSPSMAMPWGTPLLLWGNDRSAIIKFKSGQPFLSQFQNLFILTCPLEKSFTDFYSHALFVPVMYRIAALGKKEIEKAYYTTHESLITLRADSLTGEEPLRLAGSQEIIPSQHRVNDRVTLEIPKFAIDPGFYRVMHNRDTLGLVAFNLDKSESLLGQFSQDEARQLFGGGKNVSLFQAASVDTFSSNIKERYLGTPLWKYAMVLALLFLLAEVLLIRFLK